MSYSNRNGDINLYTDCDDHSYDHSYNSSYNHYRTKPHISLYIPMHRQVAQHCRLPYAI